MDHQAKTLKGSRERAVRGHGKKLADSRRGRKLTRAMENWAKPRTWHTPRRRTLTRTRERAVRGHGKKLADGRRGRKLTRAMKTGQNHVRGTRRVHIPIHGPVNGVYVDTGKNWRTAVVDGSGRAPWKTRQNHVRGTRRVHGPLHGPVNGLYVDTGKKCPTAVVDGS